MPETIVLASGSATRADLLRKAGLTFVSDVPRIDEDAVKDALAAEAASPRDIADALAEMKARKVAARHPGALVIGCDQVLDLDGSVLSKPKDRADACAHLSILRGRTHRLLSAVVVVQDATPQWRHVGMASLTMRNLSDQWLRAYVDRTWDSIGSSVGGYRIEEEGIRLFSRIDGDHFSILGLPLLDLLSYLVQRGTLDG